MNTSIIPYEIAPAYNTSVAYFSMEYAIDQALKIYSGGLGFLSGSHMRSAYELKQNLVGIGILWTYGYCDQQRDEHQHMCNRFIQKQYSFLEDTGIVFPIIIHESRVHIKAYKLHPKTFGTAPVYLLSTDIAENDYLSRTITHRLYDPNEGARIAQSMVLGIGGARLLELLNWTPEIYHMNEGHAIPLAFYLYSKYKSVQEVKKHLVFTTHTPEKAGNEEHDINLLAKMSFFGNVPIEEVKYISGSDQQFNYSLTALRMAKLANGVSRIQGEVSNQLWQSYPYICPIISITNAQNKKYWHDEALEHASMSNDLDALRKRKHQLKNELIEIVADQTGKIFDPYTLTIVWARRFAGYKRADLLLHDFKRFLELVSRDKFPVQIIWAGKPYPEDHDGIALFNHIIDITSTLPRCAILTGYELRLSAALKRGADVWLNTPRPPQEASGTSGMSAAMNATINFSVADGWFPEFSKHGINSFVIPAGDIHRSEAERNQEDYENMMNILEQEIIPTYYQQPHQWSQLMANAMKDVVPQFDSNRMAQEYHERLYNA